MDSLYKVEIYQTQVEKEDIQYMEELLSIKILQELTPAQDYYQWQTVVEIQIHLNSS